jgi:hypothetical protein
MGCAPSAAASGVSRYYEDCSIAVATEGKMPSMNISLSMQQAIDRCMNVSAAFVRSHKFIVLIQAEDFTPSGRVKSGKTLTPIPDEETCPFPVTKSGEAKDVDWAARTVAQVVTSYADVNGLGAWTKWFSSPEALIEKALKATHLQCLR